MEFCDQSLNFSNLSPKIVPNLYLFAATENLSSNVKCLHFPAFSMWKIAKLGGEMVIENQEIVMEKIFCQVCRNPVQRTCLTSSIQNPTLTAANHQPLAREQLASSSRLSPQVSCERVGRAAPLHSRLHINKRNAPYPIPPLLVLFEEGMWLLFLEGRRCESSCHGSIVT